MADAAFCPRYHKAVELIGRRWAGAIVRALLPGPARYCELSEAIPDISDRMLAERLRELEGEGVVTRTVIPSSPVRIEYELTSKGRALETTVNAIASWANEWIEGGAPEPAAKPAPTPTAAMPPDEAARGESLGE